MFTLASKKLKLFVSAETNERKGCLYINQIQQDIGPNAIVQYFMRESTGFIDLVMFYINGSNKDFFSSYQ